MVDMASEKILELTSVGLDVGSATCQFAMSLVTLRKVGEEYRTVGFDVVYESGPMLTPYCSDLEIDGKAVAAWLDHELSVAGRPRSAIDSGVVILTGLALRHRNARNIAGLLAVRSGRCISVSAGDRLEAVMSAHGSGALNRSAEGSRRVLSVDIGGGTTKLALCVAGEVVAAGALDIGGRLVSVDETGRARYREDIVPALAESVGVAMDLQSETPASLCHRLGDGLGRHLMSILVGELALQDSPLVREGSDSVPVHDADIVFSGGVAEFVAGRERRTFNDMGPSIGRHIAANLDLLDAEIFFPEGGASRATVLGASQHLVQVSGSTIAAPEEYLPLLDVPVIRLKSAFDAATSETLAAETVREGLLSYGDVNLCGALGLVWSWAGPFDIEAFERVARGIMVGASAFPVETIVLLSTLDLGRTMGNAVAKYSGGPAVVSLDGIRADDFAFLDVGDYLPGSAAVSAVVKSIQFGPVISADASSRSGEAGNRSETP